MDKILQSMSEGGRVTITNDGATILKAVPIDNAAAKILVDISKTQDAEVCACPSLSVSLSLSLSTFSLSMF
jgi:chaperonin GroEL (HSP60 family)